NKNNKLPGYIETPFNPPRPRWPGSSTDGGSVIEVITPPSIDPDTGAVYGGTTSGGQRGAWVDNAELFKGPDGRWWWPSNYRNRYTGSPQQVPASNRIQNAKQNQELALRRRQQDLARQQEQARQREQARQQRLAWQQEQARQQQLAWQQEQARQQQFAWQ